MPERKEVKIMGMMVGKYEVKLGSDAKGRTVYTLFDTITKTAMPGAWLSMTETILHAAKLELEGEDGEILPPAMFKVGHGPAQTCTDLH
jgi:hypothetical protein